MSDLILHELTLSPNNVKVRIALGYKALDYERRPLEIDGYPGDRSSIVALSGQPRLPVLQHGETVIFDSAAILRYLESNFRSTPPIFSGDLAAFGEICSWEAYGRTDISPAVGKMFGQLFEPQVDTAAVAEANTQIHAATGPIEDRLTEAEWLVGDHMTAADIVLAPAVHLGCLHDAVVSSSPFLQGFKAHFDLGPLREKTRAWVARVLRHDAVYAQATEGSAV